MTSTDTDQLLASRQPAVQPTPLPSGAVDAMVSENQLPAAQLLPGMMSAHADKIQKLIAERTAKAAVPPGRFWQAVTWDLHLTASGLIVFICLGLAEFWPSQSTHLLKLVGYASTYLIANTAGKTLPTKE